MKNILSFLLVLLTFMSVVAQNSNEKNYNLPPGFIISSKRIIYDLSFKLDNTKPVVNYSQSDLKVLKDLTAEELENNKLPLGDYYKYCKEGIAYVDSLSDKAKNIFTLNEIWYIYVFDQKLKNKLLTIK